MTDAAVDDVTSATGWIGVDPGSHGTIDTDLVVRLYRFIGNGTPSDRQLNPGRLRIAAKRFHAVAEILAFDVVNQINRAEIQIETQYDR